MEVQKIAAERLNPAAYNPRKELKPGSRDYEKLKRSIEEFGFVEPIVWNKASGMSSAATSGCACCWIWDIPRSIAWSLIWTRSGKRR